MEDFHISTSLIWYTSVSCHYYVKTHGLAVNVPNCQCKGSFSSFSLLGNELIFGTGANQSMQMKRTVTNLVDGTIELYGTGTCVLKAQVWQAVDTIKRVVSKHRVLLGFVKVEVKAITEVNLGTIFGTISKFATTNLQKKVLISTHKIKILKTLYHNQVT